MKLKDCIELELEERAQVDNVISFFTESSKKYLDDDSFFKIDSHQSSGKETAYNKIKSEIDPNRLLDDVDSNYSAAQMHSSDSKSLGFSQSKSKMSKKDMAAFMKAKLSQTKISSEQKTQASASGTTQKNFKPPIQVSRPAAPIKKPPPSLPKKQKKEESDSSEGDFQAAAERMNRPLERNYTQSSSRTNSRKKMKLEEHKSRVIDTSKNIYKPCFNMPPKEKAMPSTAPPKKEKVPRSNVVETPP